MAFDGITVAAVVQELEHTLVGGRISKIAQPENDELLLTIKGNEGQKRLYISASASLPLIYLTNENKPSPMTAPASDGGFSGESGAAAHVLYASAQAYRRRTDHRSLPAVTRAYHPPGY